MKGKPQKVTLSRWIEVDDDFVKEDKTIIVQEFTVETAMGIAKTISGFLDELQSNENMRYAINGLLMMLENGKFDVKYITFLPRLLGSDIGKYIVELIGDLVGMEYNEIRLYSTTEIIKLAQAMIEVNGTGEILDMVKKSTGSQLKKK